MGLEGIVQVEMSPDNIRRLQEANTNSTGLDAGAITGIVIGSIAGAALIVFAVWYFLLRRGSSTSSVMPYSGTAASAWTFKSLVYGQIPDYRVDATGQGMGTGVSSPRSNSMWVAPGNPLGLSWLAWGVIAVVFVLVIVGISLGIAGAAGAFNNDSNSSSIVKA